jgi:hypothetical protein
MEFGSLRLAPPFGSFNSGQYPRSLHKQKSKGMEVDELDQKARNAIPLGWETETVQGRGNNTDHLQHPRYMYQVHDSPFTNPKYTQMPTGTLCCNWGRRQTLCWP